MLRVLCARAESLSEIVAEAQPLVADESCCNESSVCRDTSRTVTYSLSEIVAEAQPLVADESCCNESSVCRDTFRTVT